MKFEFIIRYWLKKNGVEAFGGPIDEKDLHRYFNTAKSQVYVAGLFINLYSTISTNL